MFMKVRNQSYFCDLFGFVILSWIYYVSWSITTQLLQVCHSTRTAGSFYYPQKCKISFFVSDLTLGLLYGFPHWANVKTLSKIYWQNSTVNVSWRKMSFKNLHKWQVDHINLFSLFYFTAFPTSQAVGTVVVWEPQLPTPKHFWNSIILTFLALDSFEVHK